MPGTPWVKINLHPEDYILPSILPTGFSFKLSDNMMGHDLLTLAVHIHQLQNANSLSSGTSTLVTFNFRSKDEIHAATEARTTGGKKAAEIEEIDEVRFYR